MEGENDSTAAMSQNLQAVLAQMISALQATTNAAAPAQPAAGAGASGSAPASSGGDGAAGASGAGTSAGAPPGLILLPAGALPLQLQLANQNLSSLAPYLLNLSGAGALGNALQYALPLGQGPQLGPAELAALLAATSAGLPAEEANRDAAAAHADDGDGARSPGGGPAKRPGDGQPGGAAKRERIEDSGLIRVGMGRRENTQSIPNLPHLRGKCHVDGCNEDLANLSNYYKRYRTCENHLKSMTVLKDGIPQRFCQQCGRFHTLESFDGNKRSCRDRLNSHNVRRRKRTEEAAAAAANQATGIPQIKMKPGDVSGMERNLGEVLQQAMTAETMAALAAVANGMQKKPQGGEMTLANIAEALRPDAATAAMTMQIAAVLAAAGNAEVAQQVAMLTDPLKQHEQQQQHVELLQQLLQHTETAQALEQAAANERQRQAQEEEEKVKAEKEAGEAAAQADKAEEAGKSEGEKKEDAGDGSAAQPKAEDKEPEQQAGEAAKEESAPA